MARSESRAVEVAEPILVPFQYATAAQRRNADRLGMWVVLAAELMFFGALFVAYLAYRLWYPAEFVAAGQMLNLGLGSAGSIVLLLSSVTMALAVRSARVAGGSVRLFLVLTFILGLVFLALKGTEWVEHFNQGLVPAVNFHWSNPDQAPSAELFFVFYFVMTALHALHLIIGLIILAVMYVVSGGRRFGPLTAMPIELSGYYWHFLDIMWVFIFPLLYLITRHS